MFYYPAKGNFLHPATSVANEAHHAVQARPTLKNTPDNLIEANAAIARRFAAIVENSDDAIISKNLDGIIETWNKGAERIFGYTAQEAIGKPIQMLIPAGRENEEPEIIGRIRRGEAIDHYETVRRRKNGTLVEISLTVSPIKDETGKIVGASKISRDISERKRIDAIRQRLSSIVENSDDAIISKNLDGTILSWNNAAVRMFGYQPEEAIGQSILMLMPPGRENEEPSIISRIRKGERIDHYETVRQRKDGSLINVSLGISPIKDLFGNVIGASKIARDITDRIRIEENLREIRDKLEEVNSGLEHRVAERTSSLNDAVAQMQEFSYTVSHDLRTPVRAIEGYAKALLEDYGGRLDSRMIDYLGRIVSSSVRMEKLIREVLTYTRLSNATLVTVEINLDQLVGETIFNFEEFKQPHATLVVRRPLLSVIGHEISLTQALVNLLSNAIKFVAPGTSPRVELWTEDGEARTRLWIKDNGIGIKPEYHSRIFGMFERAHQDERYEGTGVGLAITRKAIEKMGGATGLESDGANGCAFWVDLPSSRKQSQAA